METLLVISPNGTPPFSARGLQQTLEPIAAAANARRTINGALVDLSATQFRKYKSTISGNDQQAPAFEGLWTGMIVTVDCIAELAYLTSTASPERDVVDGSSYVEGDFTYYRPRLTMMVVNFNEQRDEYGAQTTWQLELEEV